jgi:hypothetical protein
LTKGVQVRTLDLVTHTDAKRTLGVGELDRADVAALKALEMATKVQFIATITKGVLGGLGRRPGRASRVVVSRIHLREG